MAWYGESRNKISWFRRHRPLARHGPTACPPDYRDPKSAIEGGLNPEQVELGEADFGRCHFSMLRREVGDRSTYVTFWDLIENNREEDIHPDALDEFRHNRSYHASKIAGEHSRRILQLNLRTEQDRKFQRRIAEATNITVISPFAPPKALKTKPAKSNIVVEPFPTPEGATWSDVSIHFKDGHTVSIKVKSAKGVFQYLQMGMANKKNMQQEKQKSHCAMESA